MAALQREAHEQVNKAGQVLAELVKDIPDDEPEAPEPEKRVNWIDDAKVVLASTAGVGNLLLNIDLWLKISVSLLTLVYLGYKVYQIHCNINNK